MSLRSRLPSVVSALALLAAAPAATAAPLFYLVDPFQSSLSADAAGFVQVDVEPDLLNEFPQFHQMTGNTTTQPSFASSAVVDVGLPGNFDDGANGISFSSLSIVYADAIRAQVLGGISVPGPGAPQLAGAFFDIDGFSIVLDSPFSTTLVPSGNPNEWLWASTADVTLSGTLAATFEIPTVQEVTTPPQPFSQSLTVLLAGTFSGDQTGTQVTVGVPTDDLQNLNLSVPPLSEDLDVAGLMFSIDFSDFILADASGAVVYTNATPIPEPGTGALLAVGLVALALRHRRRARA